MEKAVLCVKLVLSVWGVARPSREGEKGRGGGNPTCPSAQAPGARAGKPGSCSAKPNTFCPLLPLRSV
jgi:hypothetical protein